MKKLTSLAGGCFLALCVAACCQSQVEKTTTLKDALGDKFLIGAAINSDQAAGFDTAGVRIIKEHFNAIVAENCMKCEVIHPEENRYDFTLADQFVAFGEKNNLTITGHTLLWHSQLAPWFCVDEQGNNVSPEVLKERIKNHITTIVSRYKGRIKGWDVVNEAIEDDGTYRNSKFYQILGEEYIALAFQYAHEADPDAELYYNDYSMSKPGKRETVVKMVNQLKERGLRVDAIGMQGHIIMDYPTVGEFETSMLAFASTGAKVMITEWDLSVLPAPNQQAGAEISDRTEYSKGLNPYPEALPESMAKAWNARMGEFFKLFIKHSDIITRVTVWGVADGDSWRNNWPVKGRTDYPVLFDRNHQPKPVVNEIIQFVQTKK